MNTLRQTIAMTVPNFITVENISLFLSGDESKKLDGADWENQTFTTFSICDTAMVEYEITEDKTLYKRDEDGLLLLDAYTGQIDFGTVLILEEKDYEVSLRALFYKGEMRDSSILEIKELDREVRERATEKLMEAVEKHESRQKSWWFKIYLFYAKVMLFLFTCVRFILGGLIKLCWFIQNKIT